MIALRRHTLAAALTLLASAGPVAAFAQGLPPSSLALRTRAGWSTWWRSTDSTGAWLRSRALAEAVRWRPGADGVAWGEIELAGSREAWRTRLVVARLDPARLDLRLEADGVPGRSTRWTIDRADTRAVLAANAGQFVHTQPWGRVVIDGHETLPPGTGPLVSTFTIDEQRAIRWHHAGAPGGHAPGVRWAFQSYPTLLANGHVPMPLAAEGLGLDVHHRDARAALGQLPDGRLLVALTRFDALGRSLGFVPFGLTAPEMAAVMASLGASEAVMLDGGISAQMRVRDGRGRTHRWGGMRSVPLGLVALPR